MFEGKSTDVRYKIENISGVVTFHRVTFTDGVRNGWRQTQTLAAFLDELERSPWCELLRVIEPVSLTKDPIRVNEADRESVCREALEIMASDRLRLTLRQGAGRLPIVAQAGWVATR